MKTEALKELILSKPLPKHIGIILDGNGRWATKRLLPRNLGHKKGVDTLREIAVEAKNIGIECLTVFAFSTENWNRPKEEVDYLLNLIKNYYHNNLNKLKEKQIKIIFIGSRKNLSNDLILMMEDIEYQSKDFAGFTLAIAFNYGSREEITQACKKITNMVLENKISVSDINEDLITNNLYTNEFPPLDLIIRTSGEQRLSNFLLFQAAYAEFYFPKTLWPDFHKKELYLAIQEYQNRNRRFGGLK